MLIELLSHHGAMWALILIPIVAIAAFLVFAAGADSRIDDVARRRGFQR